MCLSLCAAAKFFPKEEAYIAGSCLKEETVSAYGEILML